MLDRARQDLESTDADIYGPAWDFLTAATPDDATMLAFWAHNARMDVKILTEWAHRHETELVREYARSKQS